MLGYPMALPYSAKIEVSPSLTTTIDQKVDIIVRNLPPRAIVILRTQTTDDSNILFESIAKYKSSGNGEVFVSTEPSLGGSYTGVEPMGLFWSLKPITNRDRDDLLRKRDVTTPLKVTLEVYSGVDEGNLDERDKQASVTLLRCYMGAGVSRCFLDSHGFYGTLFLPPGDGPFPGIVDMWGRTGGIREDRAALLASNGFATLALGYLEYKDLPKQYDVLELFYFEKAIDWLSAHPKVKSNGVGLVGLSFGGVIALAIASQIPHKVKAAVSISGTLFLIGCSFKCGTFTIPGYPIDTAAANYTCYQNFVSVFKNKEAWKPGSSSVVPVEYISCPVLLVYGLEDKLNPEIACMSSEIFRRMDQHGIVDLWGRTGGIREDRAALLASNGFATLALGYLEYKDLPKQYDALELSYFEKAIDWLSAYPKVKSNGVGLVGLSFGGVIALAIASQIPQKVKAVVSISGHHAFIENSFKCRNFAIPGYPIADFSAALDNTCYQNIVSIYKTKLAWMPGSPSLVPVEHISSPVLLVYGSDDKLLLEIEWMSEEIFRRMEQHGKGALCKRLGLPGAGHFFTPCYLPPCSKQYVKVYDEVWYLGGDSHALQAKASEIHWNESLLFLLKNVK